MRSSPVRRRTTCSYLSWVRLGVSWMARINIGPPFRECGRRADGLLLLRRPDLAAAAGDLELGRHRLPGVGVDMGEDRLARGDLDSAAARNQQGGERQEGQRDTLQGHGSCTFGDLEQLVLPAEDLGDR